MNESLNSGGEEPRSLKGLDEETLEQKAAHLAGLLGHEKMRQDLGFAVPDTPNLTAQIKDFSEIEMRAYLTGYGLSGEVIDGLIEDIFGPKPE